MNLARHLPRHALALLPRANETKRRALDGIATRQREADETPKGDAKTRAPYSVVSQSASLVP